MYIYIVDVNKSFFVIDGDPCIQDRNAIIRYKIAYFKSIVSVMSQCLLFLL